MNIHDRFPEAIDITSEVKVIDPVPVFVGNYSFVLKGSYRNEVVAIKVLRLLKDTGLPVMRRKARREGAIWAALRHPNIAPFYGYVDDEKFGPFGAFVSPWFTHGDAAAVLRMYGMALKSAEERIQLWTGIISGVEYLHSHDPPIVHGDLKLGNVLLDDQGRPLLCDFGLARIAVENGCSGLTTTSDYTGTIRYLAPELALSDGKCLPTPESDIYALGCIGLEVVFGQTPYATEVQPRGITDSIKQGIPPGYSPGNLNPASSAIWTVLQNCWQWNPNDRPRASELLQYMRDISACIGNSQSKRHSLQDLSPLSDQPEELKEEISSLVESKQGHSGQFPSQKSLRQEQDINIEKQDTASIAFSYRPPKPRSSLTTKNFQDIERAALLGIDSRVGPNTIPSVASNTTRGHSVSQPPVASQILSSDLNYISKGYERVSSGILNSTEQIQPTPIAPSLYAGSDFINRETASSIPNVPRTLRGTLARKVLLGKVPTKYLSPNAEEPRGRRESTPISESHSPIPMSDKSILALPPSLRIFHPNSGKDKFFSGSKGSDIGSDSATNVSDRRSFARAFKRPSRYSPATSSGSSRSAISSMGSSSVSSPSIVSIVTSKGPEEAEDTMNEYILPRLLPSNQLRRSRQGL